MKGGGQGEQGEQGGRFHRSILETGGSYTEKQCPAIDKSVPRFDKPPPRG